MFFNILDDMYYDIKKEQEKQNNILQTQSQKINEIKDEMEDILLSTANVETYERMLQRKIEREKEKIETNYTLNTLNLPLRYF